MLTAATGRLSPGLAPAGVITLILRPKDGRTQPRKDPERENAHGSRTILAL